jgi:RNA polymerase sigma-70 factor (ECF subfamily)
LPWDDVTNADAVRCEVRIHERGLDLDAADRSWFEPLARTLERPAYHFAVMLVQNRATAEELVQEAFARVWASPNTPSAEPQFRRWLYRTITNLARDYHRRRLVEARLLFWNTPAVDPIDEVVHRAEDRELLRAVLAMPFKDRHAIYLHYFDGLTFAEVGEVLAVSEIAARVRVHRAVQKLRGRLGPESVAREVPA